MNKEDVHIGMLVTTAEPVEAYYSGYAGRPKQMLLPGVVGTVGAIDVPHSFVAEYNTAFKEELSHEIQDRS